MTQKEAIEERIMLQNINDMITKSGTQEFKLKSK